jgi:hypothetical protein
MRRQGTAPGAHGQAAIQPNQNFMSSDAARIMYDFIEIEQRQRAAMVETVSKDFSHLAAQLKSSEEHISLSPKNVSAVIMSMPFKGARDISEIRLPLRERAVSAAGVDRTQLAPAICCQRSRHPRYKPYTINAGPTVIL